MTPVDFKLIRLRLGMSRIEFARALGYKGSDENNATLIKRIEHGKREIVASRAIKALELDQGRKR